ncbi:MAG: hypothetical protein LBF34_03570 [Puniceicoccales bacterium]|nr:hypothetical protein [Puniceicoccales bacterium]
MHCDLLEERHGRSVRPTVLPLTRETSVIAESTRSTVLPLTRKTSAIAESTRSTALPLTRETSAIADPALTMSALILAASGGSTYLDFDLR